MPAKPRHFIWDFDGTLIDSYPHIATCFCRVMHDAGIAVNYADADATLRRSFLETKQRYRVPDAVFATFQATHVKDFAPHICPYPAARTTLTALAATGADHYIYTHRDSESLTYYLSKFGIQGLFVDAICASDGFPSKPAPDALLALCARHHLLPADCIMVGDREIDVGAGRAAGMPTARFAEFGSAPETAADVTVTSLLELLALV